MTRLTSVCIITVVVFVSSPVWAGDSEPDTKSSPSLLTDVAELPFVAAGTLLEKFFELGEVVIAGTRLTSPFEDFVAGSVSSTTSITAEDIERFGARNIPEAIQYAEGIVLSDLVGNGEEPTLDFRNFNEGQDMVLLLDGIRINEAKSNNINYPLIPLSMVERIDIKRGGESFLYGEGAVGGVVHVLTRMPEKGARSKVTGRVGSFDAWGASVEASAREDDWGLYLAGDYYETNGFRDSSSVEKGAFFSKLMRDVTDLVRVEAAYLFADARLDRPGSVREALILSSGRETNERPLNCADLESHLVYVTLNSLLFDQLSLGGNVFASKTHELSVANFATFDTTDNELDLTRKSWGFTAQAHHSREFGSFVEGALVGVDYQDNKIDEEDFNRSKATEERLKVSADRESAKEMFGVFGKVNLSWREMIGMFFGLRYDNVDFENTDVINTANNIPNSHSKLSYAVGGAIRIWQKLNVSLNFSNAYRTPNLSDLYANPGFGGNPNLVPEESTTYEIGLKWDEEGFLLAETLFANTVKSEIGFDPNLTDAASAFGKNTNFGKVRRYGLESMIEKQILPWVRFRGTHTSAEATFKTGTPANPGRQGKRIAMVPKNRYSMNLLMTPLENLDISVNMVSVGKQVLTNDLTNESNGQRLPAYTVFNLKAIYQWTDWKLSFEVKNLLDEEYEAGGSLGLTTATDSRKDNFLVVAPERSYHFSVSRLL